VPLPQTISTMFNDHYIMIINDHSLSLMIISYHYFNYQWSLIIIIPYSSKHLPRMYLELLFGA
jgi:hypothetical protein